MFNPIKKIFTRSYKPLNILEISEKNLIHNYKYLSSINKKLKIAPVLKSNAYGHGLIQVAKVMEKLQPPFMCVDSLYEAYALTNNGITTPILIMGFIDPMSLNTKKLPYSFAVFGKEQVDALAKYQPDAKIHIFIDTGMHREGIQLDELSSFVDYINKTHLTVEGLMSHFAESENKKNPLTRLQLKKFDQAINVIRPKWIHISNSGGILNNLEVGNLGRCGIGLYGISPVLHDAKLKPTLTLKTHIAQVKNVKKGDSIGYNFTFKAKKDIKIAILPIGYNDGIDRRLSNKGLVKIGKKFCKIIGRISMNITIIDVSSIKNPKVGNEVIIYSSRFSDKNSVQTAANICNTIPYELLVHLTSSTKRLMI